jgi:hypothetical protein
VPSAQEVIERHRKRLLEIPNVHGVAFGVSPTDDSKHRILVYANTDQPPAELPTTLDGYEVEWVKSSGFHAL